eukprot:jgi/Undpi1/8402/HiC_scaffold_25.g10870.m1
MHVMLRSRMPRVRSVPSRLQAGGAARSSGKRTGRRRNMPPKVPERTVLTQAELERIRAKIRNPPETDADARRRHLKRLSDERVQHWPNTLEAQRQKKENWKKKQEEEIEVKRRGIDREEAVLQRKLRAETIRKANDKLYEQTGKMKLLRSNLLYAEVIETRKDQIAEKADRYSSQEALDAAHHREIMRKVAEGEAKEKALADARVEKEKAIAVMQQEQLNAYKAKYIAGLVKEKEDGDDTQRKAKAAIEAEEELARARKLKDRAETEKMLEANNDMKAKRAERINEELAYMETCRKQRDTLDRAARARKSLEAKRFNERQSVRQAMIDKATRELENTRVVEGKKEEKEAQEQLQKEDDAAARKEQERKKLMEEIDRSREIQIKERAEREEARRVEDVAIKAYFKDRSSEMDRLDRQEEAERLAREKNLRSCQQLQAKQRKAKEMAYQAYETVSHARMLEAQGEEDSRFKKIVHGYIDEFESRGQSTYLLHRTLNHKNPDMFPAGNLKL